MPDRYIEHADEWSLRYHVPRSQVWAGSMGRASGNVHLHLPIEPRMVHTFTATSGRATTIDRRPGSALCGRPTGWYERDAEMDRDMCPRCVAMAERYGITVPDFPERES